MDQASFKIIFAAVSAVVVPAILAGSIAEGRSSLGLACAPFGWPGLLIAHLVAAVPIGLLTAGLVQRHRIVVSILISLGAIAAVGLFGDDLAVLLDQRETGVLARGLVRSVLAMLLVIPWLMTAPLRDGQVARFPISTASILVGAMLAFLPPLTYARRVIKARSADLKANFDAGRLVKMRTCLIGLSDLGGPGTVTGISPVRALRRIDELLARMEREASRDLPASARASTKLDRAFLLIQLDRLKQAEAMLRPLTESSTEATLLLGAVYRDQARWSEAEVIYRQALAGLLLGSTRDRGTQERLATAFDGLAESARSAGHPEVAERAYQEARRRLPARAGYYAFQLGHHYLDGGRPSDALAQLNQAVRLDPTLVVQVGPLIDQARTRTPACLLGPARQSVSGPPPPEARPLTLGVRRGSRNITPNTHSLRPGAASARDLFSRPEIFSDRRRFSDHSASKCEQQPSRMQGVAPDSVVASGVSILTSGRRGRGRHGHQSCRSMASRSRA